METKTCWACFATHQWTQSAHPRMPVCMQAEIHGFQLFFSLLFPFIFFTSLFVPSSIIVIVSEIFNYFVSLLPSGPHDF